MRKYLARISILLVLCMCLPIFASCDMDQVLDSFESSLSEGNGNKNDKDAATKAEDVKSEATKPESTVSDTVRPEDDPVEGLEMVLNPDFLACSICCARGTV